MSAGRPQVETREHVWTAGRGRARLRAWREEGAAVAAEYALILMVVAMAAVYGLSSLGSGISNGVNYIANVLVVATSGGAGSGSGSGSGGGGGGGDGDGDHGH